MKDNIKLIFSALFMGVMYVLIIGMFVQMAWLGMKFSWSILSTTVMFFVNLLM